MKNRDLTEGTAGAVSLRPHVVAARTVDLISPQHTIVATERSWGNPMRLCVIREHGTISLGWRYHETAGPVPENWKDEDGEYIAERAADAGTYDAFKIGSCLRNLHLPAFHEKQPICGIDYTDEPDMLLTVLSEEECGLDDQPLSELEPKAVRAALDALVWGGWGGGTDEDSCDVPIVDRVIAAASGNLPPTAVSGETIEAYLNTDYVIEAPVDTILRIGEPSPRLVELYGEYDRDTVTIVTAWNSLGAERGDDLNTLADAHLRTDIREIGIPSLEARGESRDSTWPAERSHAIFGLGLAEAVHLGRVFGQNAIVWSGADALPKLILLR